MNQENDKEKLIRLFEFLKQYNNIKNPVIQDINKQQWNKNLDNIPNHEDIINNIYKSEEDQILIVKKPELRNCPSPSKTIESWIEGEWKNPKKNITNKKSIDIFNNNYDLKDEKSKIY